jgi:hypothetical protein
MRSKIIVAIHFLKLGKCHYRAVMVLYDMVSLSFPKSIGAAPTRHLYGVVNYSIRLLRRSDLREGSCQNKLRSL